MSQETKTNIFDVIAFFAAMAVILMIWAAGSRYINKINSKFIQEVECDGQGK